MSPFSRSLTSLTFLFLAAPAMAMPTGTFECKSPDGKFIANFYISNYGLHVLGEVTELTIDGKELDPAKAKARVSRQWVTTSTGNVTVSIPAEDVFSRDLVIETSSRDGSAYEGRLQLLERTDEYSSPEKAVRTAPVACEWVP